MDFEAMGDTEMGQEATEEAESAQTIEMEVTIEPAGCEFVS